MSVAVEEQLDDEPLFLFAEQWLDGSDDPGVAADLEPVADFERILRLEVAGRHDRLSLTKLVPVLGHHVYNGRAGTTDR